MRTRNLKFTSLRYGGARFVSRKFLAAAALIAFCVSLIACFQDQASEKRLKLLWFGSNEENEAIQKLLTKFEVSHPGWTVELQPVEWGRYKEKLLTMLVGRRAPDVARMTTFWCPRFGDLGAFADGRKYFNDEDLQDFDSGRLSSCRDGDHLNGLPHTSVGLLMFYNKTVAHRLGLAIPTSPETAWTWEELEGVSRRFREEGGMRYGWATYRSWVPFLSFVYQGDGQMASPDGGGLRFLQPDNLRTLTWFVEQHRSGMAPPSAWTHGDSGETLFMRGICPMVITGNWRLVLFNDRIDTFEWDVTYLPRDRRVATNTAGENLMVFKTRNEKMAFELVRFLTSPESMTEFCSEVLFLPTRESLATADFPFERFRPQLQKFQQQGRFFESDWAKEQSDSKFSDIQEELEKQIELCILGQTTPEQALKALDESYRSNW